MVVLCVLLFIIALIVLAVKISGNFLLTQWVGFKGLTMATTTAHVTFAVLSLLLIVFKSKMKKSKELFISLIKLIAAAFILIYLVILTASELAWLVEIPIEGITKDIFELCILGILILAIYLGLLYIFGMKSLIISMIKGNTDE